MSSEQLENFEELARRAVACKRWYWMPGMLAVMPTSKDGSKGTMTRITEGSVPLRLAHFYPHLLDPATLGCVLALVREAWGGPTIGLWCDFVKTIWIVGDYEGELATAPTEAEALVAALEGAS